MRETPWAVYCYNGCNGAGLVFLSEAEYTAQMMRPDSLWRCPQCGGEASWSDSNYEKHMEAEADKP